VTHACNLGSRIAVSCILHELKMQNVKFGRLATFVSGTACDDRSPSSCSQDPVHLLLNLNLAGNAPLLRFSLGTPSSTRELGACIGILRSYNVVANCAKLLLPSINPMPPPFFQLHEGFILMEQAS
jgi:hypothetical protein